MINKKEKEYSLEKIYKDLALSEEVYLLPFMLEEIGINSELMQPDGIHPNKEGTIKVSETIKKSIINIIN